MQGWWSAVLGGVVGLGLLVAFPACVAPSAPALGTETLAATPVVASTTTRRDAVGRWAVGNAANACE